MDLWSVLKYNPNSNTAFKLRFIFNNIHHVVTNPLLSFNNTTASETVLYLVRLQFIPDGYASHLSQLEYNQRSRPAKSTSARMVLRKGSFGLGAAGGDFLRKRNHIFRTISSQQPGGAGGSASPSQPGRTERTQSQCEMERERGIVPAAQRSMSIAAGCWGRSASAREGSSGLLGPK